MTALQHPAAPRRRLFGLLAPAGALLLVGAAFLALACGAPTHEEPTQVEPVEPAAVPAPGSEAARAEPIEVSLTEFSLRAPAVVPPGPTRFIVSNLGEIDHSFTIAGESGGASEGFHRQLDETLAPGKTASITVDLRPGTYRLYCPMDDHAGKGMSVEMTVDPEVTKPLEEPSEAP